MPKDKQRRVLTLKERLDVLRRVEGGRSCRAVATELKVGKTQIQNIIKEKESLLKQWAEGGNSHERPPRLNDHFLAYKGVVVQARDYCICCVRSRLSLFS